MRAQSHRLVFIDETSVKMNMTRLRARAPKGKRLNASAPFGRWRTQTFIAGLAVGALIAPWIIEGAINGESFATYIETQLAPALEPGAVVILDNLAVHRNARAARAVKERGCWFLYLPPYSPGPQSHQDGLRQAKGPSARCGRKDLRSPHAGYRRHL